MNDQRRPDSSLENDDRTSRSISIFSFFSVFGWRPSFITCSFITVTGWSTCVVILENTCLLSDSYTHMHTHTHKVLRKKQLCWLRWKQFDTVFYCFLHSRVYKLRLNGSTRQTVDHLAFSKSFRLQTKWHITHCHGLSESVQQLYKQRSEINFDRLEWFYLHCDDGMFSCCAVFIRIDGSWFYVAFPICNSCPNDFVVRTNFWNCVWNFVWNDFQFINQVNKNGNFCDLVNLFAQPLTSGKSNQMTQSVFDSRIEYVDMNFFRVFASKRRALSPCIFNKTWANENVRND